MGLDLLPAHIFEKFEVEETHHASSVLFTDFRAEWDDLVAMLTQFVLKRSHIEKAGGRKSDISTDIDTFFYDRGWIEHKFRIEVSADGRTTLAPTHQVDYFRNRVAIETEWNNKDPFYDRDLTTFRLLFELSVLSVGVIITRASELQDIFEDFGRGSSYGNPRRIWANSLQSCVIVLPVVVLFLPLESRNPHTIPTSRVPDIMFRRGRLP